MRFFSIGKPKHPRKTRFLYPIRIDSLVQSQHFVERRKHLVIRMILVILFFHSTCVSFYQLILGFPFKIEHAHLPQLLHFTDEVPVRFMNTIVNPTSSASASSSSSLPTTGTGGSMGILTTSMISNGSTIHDSLQPLSIIPPETPPPLLSSFAPISSNNKSLDTKKYRLKNEVDNQ